MLMRVDLRVTAREAGLARFVPLLKGEVYQPWTDPPGSTRLARYEMPRGRSA